MAEEATYQIPKSERIGTVVVKEIVTNGHCRIFSFRVPIEGYANWHRQNGWQIDPTNRPECMVLISEILGVESLLLNTAYSLMVSKGEAFDWEEIQPRVLDILELHNKRETR